MPVLMTKGGLSSGDRIVMTSIRAERQQLCSPGRLDLGAAGRIDHRHCRSMHRRHQQYVQLW